MRNAVMAAGLKSMMEQTLTEEELLLKVRRGDAEAYKHIVLRYMQSAYYVALGLLRNHQDALDLSQDAFIRAFRKRRQFDPDRPFFPWFYRLLRNLCLDHIKKVKRRDEVPLDEARILGEEAEDRDLKRLIRTGLDILSDDQREMIILRYFRQMSYQEIAELTGKPLGTVMSTLFYAKKRLKVVIQKYIGTTENGDDT